MVEKNNNQNTKLSNEYKYLSKSYIGGFFLIIAGIISLLMWIGFAYIDIPFIETTILPEFKSLPIENTIDNISPESIKEILIICGSIGFLFPYLQFWVV